MRWGVHALGLSCLVVVAAAPRPAKAQTECGTVDAFNAAMAAAGTSSADVVVTFDVVGVHPDDFFNDKGSLAQMRDTSCAGGADATIKVYGTSDPLNEAHPPGTLKLEYGNICCGGDCGERWADPNPSAAIFLDGTETCTVSMWIKPTEVGYTLECNTGTFEALGDNPDGNVVDEIALLRYLLPGGGTTWELPGATADNDEVCWETTPGGQTQSVTVSVAEDVTVGPAWPDTVFPDDTDLAVEADGTAAYLKFEIPPIEGRITQVRLLLHSRPESSSEGDGGEVHLVAENAWSEGTLTWNDRPAYDVVSLGRIGPVSVDTEVGLDLGDAITDSGTQSLLVFSPPTDGNGTHFYSKEGSAADAPRLVVTYDVVDADGDGTPDGPDCNDADPAVGPDADEICNGVDDDCDDEVDEGCDGETSGGGSDEAGGSSGDDGDDGSDGTGAGSGPAWPGSRGADIGGCACRPTPAAPALLPLLLLALGVAPRRRSGSTPAR